MLPDAPEDAQDDKLFSDLSDSDSAAEEANAEFQLLRGAMVEVRTAMRAMQQQNADLKEENSRLAFQMTTMIGSTLE